MASRCVCNKDDIDIKYNSSFNIPEILPIMSGKPHKIHVDNDDIPYIAYTSIPILHYWKKEVKEQLDEDVRLGYKRPHLESLVSGA